MFSCGERGALPFRFVLRVFLSGKKFCDFFEKAKEKSLQNIIKYAIIIKLLKRPHGQAVKTPPSHGGNWGSIPHGATKKKGQVFTCPFFLIFSTGIPAGARSAAVRASGATLSRGGPFRGFGCFPMAWTGFYLSFLFWYSLREYGSFPFSEYTDKILSINFYLYTPKQFTFQNLSSII